MSMFRRSQRLYTFVNIEQLQHSFNTIQAIQTRGVGRKRRKASKNMLKILLPFTYFYSMTEPCLRAAGSSVLFT